jgi:hypothetical protein
MGTYDGVGSSVCLGGSGDADLTAISGFDTLDAVSLSFDFVPDADQIFIQFPFLSTEHPGFVNTEFNDVFAFFVNGTNLALVPGTTDAVTINSINVDRPVEIDVSNPILIGTREIHDRGFAGADVIPEPGTWMLMISGFAGLLVFSRRRTSRSKETH